MFIQREFKLISGRIDYQYVSSVNSNGQPTGYDRDIRYALNLSEWHIKRCVSFFESIGSKYQTSLS